MAKKPQMTVTMLKRFEEMVDAQFEDVAAEASALDNVQRRKVEVEVKKELGIYDLYVELLKHETAVKEIKEKLRSWEDRKHRGRNGYVSEIENLVNIRLGGDDALPSTQINRAKQKIKDKMLFCSMPDEVKQILEEIPGLLKDIKKKLPKASTKEIAEADPNNDCGC